MEKEEVHSTQDSHKSHSTSTGFIFHFHKSVFYEVRDDS